jgi:CRP-like cAMP-binding protein
MEGQNPNDVYFLQRGEIKTYKTSNEGKELITGMHHDGEFIGYLPLLENKPYNETAVALADSEVYLIPKDDFLTLIYSNKEIAKKFIKLLTNDLLEAEKRLLDMAYQSVRQRVAGALLMIHDQYRADKNQEVITISRKDISSIVGTATESLNRSLADLKDEKLIELGEQGIRILEREKLERVAQ